MRFVAFVVLMFWLIRLLRAYSCEMFDSLFCGFVLWFWVCGFVGVMFFSHNMGFLYLGCFGVLRCIYVL